MAMGVDFEDKDQEQEEMLDVGSSPGGAPVAEPTSTPSSPPLFPGGDASALPGDAASKRQRRPNVRLNEIGSESSLANVVEYLLKRKGRRGGGVVGGGKRGRVARNNKHTPSITAPGATTTSAPGKLSKKPKLSPKFKSDDDDDDDDDDDVLHHAEESKPDKEKFTPTGRIRKVRLGKSRFPDHSMGSTIAKRAKHPKVIYPNPPEGNGNNWMHKAMTGVADGFLEAADGGVYGCSDTDKRANSPSPHVQPTNFSFDSGSPKGFTKAQATTPRKKKVGTGPKAPRAKGCVRRDKAEKEEPSSSDVQELRLQGPVWERGIPPLDDKVREWIQGIGLEKYASLFQHHEVGDDVVPLLTLDDLKEMGINAVGARRKFFCEITKRRQGLMVAAEPLTDEK